MTTSTIQKCPLTGQTIDLKFNLSPAYYYYQTPKTGKVKFTDVAYPAASELGLEEKEILAGICRNRTIKGEEPIMITYAFLEQLKNQEIPYGFEERARYLLQYFYDHGGKEYEEFDMDSDTASPIVYASRDQFERIMKYLMSEGSIDYRITETDTTNFYQQIQLTKAGIMEIEKGLPKMPMYGLVSQEIKTGTPEIDNQIEHARKLFFDKHSTLESKRSACEVLSYILEPLRNELKAIFKGDAETFFNLVNNFDIRHNKVTTKNIEHEEQLEWVFYSLLNTINTYNKMKKKLR
jgi:hypothetical protein